MGKHNGIPYADMTILSVRHGWPNFLTRGPNSRLAGRWRAGDDMIYVNYAKIGC